MKFHKQEHIYIPGTLPIRGSCYPTVLACLLDLELDEVPYFHLFYWTRDEKINIEDYYNKKAEDLFESSDGKYSMETCGPINQAYNLWLNVKENWLASQRYQEELITDIDTWLIENKDKPYMVFGRSERDVGHVVIYQNGEMIHDPHPSNSGLVTIDVSSPFRFLNKF